MNILKGKTWEEINQGIESFKTMDIDELQPKLEELWFNVLTEQEPLFNHEEVAEIFHDTAKAKDRVILGTFHDKGGGLLLYVGINIVSKDVVQIVANQLNEMSEGISVYIFGMDQ